MNLKINQFISWYEYGMKNRPGGRYCCDGNRIGWDEEPFAVCVRRSAGSARQSHTFSDDLNA